MSKADVIKDIEHVCDGRTRGIIDRLNRTFVTPLDREDIHSLAISLDDVMDAIDAAAAVIRLYKITQVRPGARRLADIVCDSMDLHHRGARCAREAERRPRAGRARQPARTRSRPRPPGRHRRRCSTKSATRSPSSSGRRSSTSSRRPPTAAKTSATCSKASSSSTGRRAGMDSTLLAVLALISVALIFDYINGFHDAANSIATVVSTRVLTPGKAVDLGGLLQLPRRLRLRHRGRRRPSATAWSTWRSSPRP